MQKTIFITGASSGLGKSTAKLCHANGWHVIATMRNPETENELKALPNVTLVQLDVTNQENIKHTISEVLKSHAVDAVLNNAGYGLIGPLEALTDEQIQTQVQTTFRISAVVQLKNQLTTFSVPQSFIARIMVRVYKSQPNIIILEYQVHGKVPHTGKAYDNRFCSIITIENKKIIHWRDYMDSLAVMLSVTPD